MEKNKYYTVNSLLSSEVEEERTVVEDVIKGNTVSLLSAYPKMGKTFWALQMADSISKGNPFLEKNTIRNNVLYICLDDSEANFKRRLESMKIEENNNLHIVFSHDFSIKDTISIIKKVNEKITPEQIGFLIVDMFNDTRELNAATENSNAEIKKDIMEFRKMSEDFKVAILLIHHNKKEKSSNCNNRALGGIQLTGSINGAILILDKEDMKAPNGTMFISGRNIPSDDLKFKWDSVSGLFSKADETDEKIQIELENIREDELDEDFVKILNFITKKESFTGTIQELCTKLKLFKDPRRIGIMLSKHEKGLLRNGVKVERWRSNGVRLITLSLLEEFNSSNAISMEVPLETTLSTPSEIYGTDGTNGTEKKR